MYEYDDQVSVEQKRHAAAAMVIQRRWREFLQHREIASETNKTRSSVTLAAAAAVAAIAEEATRTELENEPQVLLYEYASLSKQRSDIVETNLACQRQLARYFAAQRQRKGEEQPRTLSPEVELQYWSALKQLREERCAAHARKENEESLLTEMQARHQNTVDRTTQQEEEFRQYIKQLAEQSTFVRTNQHLTAEEVESFLQRDLEQRREIKNARIRHFLLLRKVAKLQKTTVQHEEQQDGMNLIDFEQLKIENTNLNEKIEERNEDLLKLRGKVTTTIHVLTHVKEKLEFMKVENTQLRRQVATTEEELNDLRDKLAQTKKRRDHFTTCNIKMREKMPMVGSEKLLLDYEQRKAASNAMRESVLGNASKHRELLAAIDRQQTVLNGLQKSLALGTPAPVVAPGKKKKMLV